MSDVWGASSLTEDSTLLREVDGLDCFTRQRVYPQLPCKSPFRVEGGGGGGSQVVMPFKGKS